MPLLQVNSSPIQKSESQSSLLSVQSAGSYESAVSAFSNASPDAVKALKSFWEEIDELRLEQERNINDIKVELQAMTDSFNVQKNVNMTIKEGLKKIRQLVDAIDRDHQSAKAKEDFYQRLQDDCEDLRQDKRKTRERLHAKVLRNVVLASNVSDLRLRKVVRRTGPQRKPSRRTSLNLQGKHQP